MLKVWDNKNQYIYYVFIMRFYYMDTKKLNNTILIDKIRKFFNLLFKISNISCPNGVFML